MLNRRITTSGGRLRVIDKVGLGRDSMMLVVSVCGKLVLVGVSAQRVEKLADLDVTEEEYISTAFNNTQFGQNVMPFSDILSTVTASMGIKKKSQTNQEKKKEDVNSANTED